MRRFISITAACGAAAIIASKPAPAPNASAEQLLDSLVAANARSLSLDRGRLTGGIELR